MAERVEIFDVTLPAGGSPSAPVSAPVGFTQGRVDRLQVVFPDGCAGLVGVQLAFAGQVVIPYGPAFFLRGNDEVVDWPLDAYPTNGQWTLVGYNQDVYPHVIQVRWLVTELGATVSLPAPVALIEPTVIEQTEVPARPVAA